MSDFKTEIMRAGFKIFSDVANESDVSQFTDSFNKYAKEGWALVAYSYMAEVFGVHGSLLATFRKQEVKYEYRSEIIKDGFKLFSDKANESDALQLNDSFNEHITEGWELVAYSHMSTVLFGVRGSLLATFRRKITI